MAENGKGSTTVAFAIRHHSEERCLTVVAKVVAHQASIEAVKSELLKLVEPTRKEDGCIDYRLHQDNDDRSVFIFYENWESLSHLGRHMESDHFKGYIAAVDGLIADKAVHLLTAIG